MRATVVLPPQTSKTEPGDKEHDRNNVTLVFLALVRKHGSQEFVGCGVSVIERKEIYFL